MTKKQLSIVENKIHPKVRLNAICPYFTMFPLTFPYKVLQKAKKSDIVFDPFCGRGTTNFAARLLGISSYGIDSNPVAYAIAQSKLINVKPQEVISLCQNIIKNIDPINIPEGEFWRWAFFNETLNDICKVREYLNSKNRLNKVEIALRAILLGVLHGPLMKDQASYLSNQLPRTFSTKPDYSVKYWKEHSLKPQYVDLFSLVKRKSEYVFNDQMPKKVGGKIILGDSRSHFKIFNEKFDWVITSPPYFGMASYEQDQWLRNWFLGGSPNVDYSSRSQLKHWSENSFVRDLSRVWKNTAKKCKPGAKLVIRFGALPSKSNKTPTQLLKESLILANCGWKLGKIVTAGMPLDSKRQANQFKILTGKYVEEIDAFAKLNI